MTSYYVTWQPTFAEAGDFFLTHFESESADLTLGQILDEVMRVEDAEPFSMTELCSVIRTDAPASVVY